MQSFYDLQVLSDQRIEKHRAEANRERMVSEARRSNTDTTGVASDQLVARVLRLRSHLLHGLTPSFDRATPRVAWSSQVADVTAGQFTSGTTFVGNGAYPPESGH